MHIFSVGLCLFCWTVLTAGSPLFLTQYIKSNKIAEGRNLSVVDPQYFLNITSYSGYLTVDESHDSNLFFWYFPVAGHDPSKAPLIIWLQGGPGGTSLFGTFMEVGPFYLTQLNDTSKTTILQRRSTSWGNNHSLLFIDNPVGTGFSFSRDLDGYVTNLDSCAGQLYNFLQQFLTVFPELRPVPLFIAGESYAGRYVPTLARKVLENKDAKDEKINLQGLIMGNPLLSRTDAPNASQIFYQWGLIDQQGVLAAKELQDSYLQALKNKQVSEAHDLWDRLLDKLQNLSVQPQLYNVLQYKTLDTHILINYLNSKEVKENLHARCNDITLINSDVQLKLEQDFLLNMDSTMNLLLEHYKILIYCGQLDLTEPCVPNAEARRKNWQWSGRSTFLKAHRKPLVTSTIAGYFKSGGNFTEVLISGAGHLVPIDKPVLAQRIVTHFVKGEELPTDASISFKDDVPDLDVPNSNLNNNTKQQQPSNSNNNTKQQQPVQIINSTNAWNTVSWVLNGILITVFIVCGVFYVRQRRRTHDYLIDDEDSLNNAVLTMS